uniref:K-exchanger-like protein n=1 Tax=Oryza sativa subsp. japonica TaxID=39947 RepID=Q652K5_ORYSJ|nr:K-exchanger -like protein [Oryza sativa Japonica Group]
MFAHRLVDLLHSLLYLPRRLTISDITAHRWSKRTAVASALLSPLLLAAITAPHHSNHPPVLLTAAAAAATTDADSPPMSRSSCLPVLWSYVLTRELVSLLVSIGVAAGVAAGMLGVTVLAWGNSRPTLPPRRLDVPRRRHRRRIPRRSHRCLCIPRCRCAASHPTPTRAVLSERERERDKTAMDWVEGGNPSGIESLG